MVIDKFIKLAVRQDNRNSFSILRLEDCEKNKFFKLSNELIIPNSMKEFYMYHNPESVEINTNELGTIKFYSYYNLKSLQKDYCLNKCFIFATMDSDPIFIKEEKKYIYEHGTNDEKFFEKLANNFLEFIDIICNDMM